MSSTPRSRRFWPPRFSLRGLLLAMTLLCLVFAPLLPELNRSRRIARQVKLIEEMGGQCVFVDRPRSFYAGLVQRVWPVQIAHLEQDLLMAEFNAQTVDLAMLRETPDIRGVCFNECLFVLPDDETDVRLPRIEYVQLQERDDVKGGKPDPAILRRFPAFFPNLRKAQLMGVPLQQDLIDQLAKCGQLEDLDVWFAPPLEQVDTTALGGLANLRRFRVSDGQTSLNWSFLKRLENLEDIEIASEQRHVGGYHYAHGLPLRGMIPEPCHALTGHKRIHRFTLFDEGMSVKQLQTIADNNDLELVRVGQWSMGSTTYTGTGLEVLTVTGLEALKNEKRLHSLGWVRVQDDAEGVFDCLKRMTALRELEIHFTNLTDADLRLLSELKSLQRIILSFDPHQGKISDEGIALFRKLPIVELEYRYLTGLPLAEGMQRLVDSWPGPGSGKPFRQTDEGVEFLRREALK